MLTVELQTGRGLDALTLVERPTPAPAAGEILIRVHAATLNYRDLAIVNGTYGDFPRPLVPVSDGAGEVVAIGTGVTRFAVGDRVSPQYVVDWLHGPATADVVARRLGGPLDGVLCEYVCVHEQAAVHVPKHMTMVEAASLPIAGVTAWQALFVQGRVKAGDVVVVQGSGGVSVFALQLARLAGARVIATTSTSVKADHLRALGAGEVINYREQPDWHSGVMAVTGGRGADHVIEVVGGDNLARSVAACRVGGCISLIGFLADMRASLELPELFRRVLTLHAISVGSRAAFQDLVAACETGELRPAISRVFALTEYREAFEYLAAGRHIGKVAIGLV